MKTRLLMVSVAVLCLGAVPVTADLIYDMGNATLDFTQSTSNLLVRESGLSQLYVELDDPAGAALDNVAIIGGANFDLAVDLTMVQLGVNTWSASGTLAFTDIATGTNAVEAMITGASVTSTGTSLEIRGALQGEPVLVNRGDPWVFVGNADGGGADQDSTSSQITVLNPESYDGGTILTLKFGMTLPLDEFFGQDRLGLTGGEVKGAIVPVPAAVLLGMLGMGIAGLKLRKHA